MKTIATKPIIGRVVLFGILFLLMFTFEIKTISYALLYLLFTIYFFVTGIYIIIQDKELTPFYRALWLVLILIFRVC